MGNVFGCGRAPSPADYNYNVGDIWISITTRQVFRLVTVIYSTTLFEDYPSKAIWEELTPNEIARTAPYCLDYSDVFSEYLIFNEGYCFPLFMWAGGKSRMIKHYKPHIPKDGKLYIEPFCGSGAMFLYVRTNIPSYRDFVLNDTNSEIVNLYIQVRDNLQDILWGMDNLSEEYLALSIPDRRDFYYNLRHEYTECAHIWSPVREAFTLYFLLKTCFNGIWQTTKASKGRFGTPCGRLMHTAGVYDKVNTADWSMLLQDVKICSEDWRQMARYDHKDAWFFMDPPYRGGHMNYGSEFSDNHQLSVLDFMRSADSDVTLCNRDLGDNFFTRHLPYGYSMTTIDVIYTAGRRLRLDNGAHRAKRATEVFIYPEKFAA